MSEKAKTDIDSYLKTLLSKPLNKPASTKRIKSNIPGFDALIGGGFLPGSIVAIAGGMASGKTLFALQSFLERDFSKRKGLIISFSEKEEDIRHIAGKLGLSISKQVKIFVMNRAITKQDEFIINLSETIKEENITDLLINSVSDMHPDPLFADRLGAILKHYNMDSLLVYSTSKDYCAPNVSTPNDAVFNISDAVIFLNYNQEKEKRTNFLSVQKFRNSGSKSGFFGLGISDGGIHVFKGEKDNQFDKAQVINAVTSTNDIAIDRMLLESFKKVNPNVDLRLTSLDGRNYENGMAEVRKKIAANNCDIDIISCHAGDFPMLIREDMLAPVTQYFSEYYPNIMNKMIFKNGAYGVPASSIPYCTIYRKDLFRKYGIKFPGLLWSFSLPRNLS